MRADLLPRRTTGLLFLAGSALLVAAPASAAVRHAAPSGAGTTCSSAVPCSFVTAIGPDLSTGDEVVLAAGDYPTLAGQTVVPKSGVELHGASRQARAVLHIGGGGQLQVFGTNRISDLDIESTSFSPALKLDSGGTGDRLRIEASGSNSAGGGLELYGGTLSNSVVRSTTANARAVQTRPNGSIVTATLRNVTIIASGAGGTGYYVAASGSVGTTTANLTNAIVRSTQGVGIASSTGGGTAAAHVNLDHSNIDTSTEGTGATLADLGGNQIQTPVQLVDIAAGNLRQLPGSPTIGAGRNDPANGPLDLDGNPRQTGTTDIGAYEQPAPVVVPPADPGVTPGTDPGTDPTAPPAAPPTDSGAPVPPPFVPKADAPGPAVPARLTSRKLKVRSHRAVVGLSCPASARNGCAGRLVVGLAGRPSVAVDYRLAAGKRKTLRLRLSKAQEARVRRAGRRGLRTTVRLSSARTTVAVVLRRR